MDVAAINLLRQQVDDYLWPDADEKLRRKRERILLAATDLFVRQGYRKTSMGEVARAAAVAKGTVYLYYRNKAELVYHAIALEQRTYLDGMLPVLVAAHSARERLHALIALGVRMSREMPLSASLIHGDHEISLAIADDGAGLLEDVNRREMDIMVQLLDAATDNRWPHARLNLRGQVLLDLLYAVGTSALVHPHGLSWHTYASALADVLVDGVLSETSNALDSTPHAPAPHAPASRRRSRAAT